jgi:hypothetical protein
MAIIFTDRSDAVSPTIIDRRADITSRYTGV